MTNDERNIGIQLIREQKFEEAYNYFGELYNSQKDDEALYLHSLIDFSYLKKNIEQTTKDFVSLADGKSNYSEPSTHLCALLFNMQDDALNTIKYGEKALKSKGPAELSTDLKIEILSALSQSYCQLGEDENYLKALEYVNQALAIEEDGNLFLDKADVLNFLRRFEEALTVLDEYQTRFGTNGTFYLCKANILYNLGVKSDEKDNDTDKARDYFHESLDMLDICANYDMDPKLINLRRALIYSSLKDYDNAISAIDSVKDPNMELSLIIEKFRIADACDRIEDGVKFCLDYLNTHDSPNNWMVEYSIGFAYFRDAKTKEDLLKAKEYYVKAYNTSKELFVLYELYFCNNELELFEENYEIIKKAYEENNDEEGRLAFYYANMAQVMDCPYDMIEKLFKESYDKGYLNDNEFLDEITIVCENPKIYYKQVKQATNIKKTSDAWIFRKMGVRYLYGEDGIRPNKKSALVCFTYADNKSDRPCIKTSFGRYYELALEDYSKAYEYYNAAYDLYNKDPFPSCHCALGYMAYALYFGIGVKEDKLKARNLLLNDINKHLNMSSNVAIYFYSYLAMKGEENFSLEKALKCLKSNYSFYRYEITRFVYVAKICRKLGIDYDEEVFNDCVNKTFIYGTPGSKKYYKNAMKEDCPLPFKYNY